MAIQKRQVIIATMVLALGVAVYLNWQFSGERELKTTETLETVKELGESQFVNNPAGLTSSGGSAGEAAEVAAGEGAVSSEGAQQTSGTASQYFAEARLARQKSRDESIELLNSLVKDLEATDKAKLEAVKQAAEMAKSMSGEASLESVIKAKGFADCMVHLQNDTCTVVVQADELLPSDAITIRDAVNSQAGTTHENIKIINVK